MRRALADLSFVRDASDELRRIIVPAYVQSFHRVNGEWLRILMPGRRLLLTVLQCWG